MFVRSLANDLGEADAPHLWIAKDFKNGSVMSTVEQQAVVKASQAERFNDGVQTLSKFKTKNNKQLPDFLSSPTVERFASLRHGLDFGEPIGIGVFDIESGKPMRLVYMLREQLERIADTIEPEVRYVGAVIGKTHEWNKGAKQPYLTIREINSGELIKCSYEDNDYPQVAKLFRDKSAIVIIEGLAVFNRITEKTEILEAHAFDLAPEFSGAEYERFFGCAPGMTGNLSAAEYISIGRDV